MLSNRTRTSVFNCGECFCFILFSFCKIMPRRADYPKLRMTLKHGCPLEDSPELEKSEDFDIDQDLSNDFSRFILRKHGRSKLRREELSSSHSSGNRSSSEQSLMSIALSSSTSSSRTSTHSLPPIINKHGLFPLCLPQRPIPDLFCKDSRKIRNESYPGFHRLD